MGILGNALHALSRWHVEDCMEKVIGENCQGHPDLAQWLDQTVLIRGRGVAFFGLPHSNVALLKSERFM